MSAARRGPGRPPKPEGTARVSVFTLKLSDDERAVIEDAARASGLPVTQWAREAMLRAAKEIAERPRVQ